MPPKKATEPAAETVVDKTGDDKTTTQATPPTGTPEVNTGGYTKGATDLADATYSFIEDATKKIEALLTKVGKVQQIEPRTNEATVHHHVTRIPMAVDDLTRALEGLRTTVGDLRRATGS
jgi:hypothetical protein